MIEVFNPWSPLDSQDPTRSLAGAYTEPDRLGDPLFENLREGTDTVVVRSLRARWAWSVEMPSTRARMRRASP
ncbi:MAG: hypothetical protein OXF41_21780 [bacterium]|nr:hypothetical protein [bacterium]